MICVSIGRGRRRQVLEVARQLVEQGTELVELRLDYLRGKIQLGRLLEERPCPVVVTIRRECDGGRFTGREEDRQVLLRSAIASGVEYVDLEEDIAASIPRFGDTKRIVSHHDFRKTPDNLEEIHARLAALDADIVKLATMANSPRDNLRMLRLVQHSKIPTVGLCMGEIGTPSRILAGRFGAPFTFATFHHERTLAPGQLSFQEMKENYHYDDITPETEIYGVIGDPIGHSLSPLIHNTSFREHGLAKAYIPFRVPREDLSDFFEDARELGLCGLSVTIPHKEGVLDHLTSMDEGVRGIGAANTVVFDGDSQRGYNTDYQAAMDSLNQAFRRIDVKATDVRRMTALILGSGGVARAIGYGLAEKGCEVVITSRTTENAEKLADRLRCGAVEWENRYSVDTDILVNCTPLGMHPKVDETPFEKLEIKPSMVVFDTVYNPENTLFIKDARSRGCHVVTGVDMFVRQAALQYQLFTGRDAPDEVMRSVLKRATSAVKF